MRRSDPDWGISVSTTGEFQRASSAVDIDSVEDAVRHAVTAQVLERDFRVLDDIVQPPGCSAAESVLGRGHEQCAFRDALGVSDVVIAQPVGLSLVWPRRATDWARATRLGPSSSIVFLLVGDGAAVATSAALTQVAMP